jgi:hypothetical protein
LLGIVGAQHITVRWEWRGIALIFIISGISLWVTSSYAFANPRIRNLEEEIPDAIPDEPEEAVAVPGDEEAQPAMQTSSG